MQTNIPRTFTYYLNSSVSCAITLLHHGVTTLVSPIAFFPVGTPNALKKTHLKKNKNYNNKKWTKTHRLLFLLSLLCDCWSERPPRTWSEPLLFRAPSEQHRDESTPRSPQSEPTAAPAVVHSSALHLRTNCDIKKNSKLTSSYF